MEKTANAETGQRTVSPLAGKRAPASLLVDLNRLETAYYDTKPDPAEPTQLVSFGTSGHRGSSLRASFTETHILAITQAICDYRRGQGVDGPLYMGRTPTRCRIRHSALRWRCWPRTASRRSSSVTTG